MMDFNDKLQVARVRSQLKGLGQEAVEYFEFQIKKLDTLTGITKYREVEGRREAIKILKEILGFIK